MENGDPSEQPVLRHNGHQRSDKLGARFVDKTSELQEKAAHKNVPTPNKGPAGGFDDTPVPHVENGYTLKITFHRAKNLPFSDFNTISSDPYILATLKTDLPKRHRQDPDLVLRTPTIHRNVNPEWNTEWIVANVPRSGFFLKSRIYDEDPADHDDRLGNVHVYVNDISERWQGFREQEHDIKKRMGSKRAYAIRAVAAMVSRDTKMGGHLVISIENLGRTEGDYNGRMFTAGPMPWSRHFSPLIGRLTGVKDTDENTDSQGQKKEGSQKYNFQAVQMQLKGPVPEPLYHRYVEFKPFVAGMFTSHSLRGRILNRALHHQHARIYNYDRSTIYGIYQKPCMEMTKQFLEFLHWDQGGRIFTYVITLDAQWRFTETGKEFGIDMLSKHTMHSDVSIYIAFSGEFFIRRLKHPKRNQAPHPEPSSEALPPAPDSDEENEVDNVTKAGRPRTHESSKDPHDYELIIDNDSGTYRPNAKYLHTMRDWLQANLPNLRVTTLDCQGDEEKMKKLKDEQREKKKNTGKQVTYLQNSSQSSISSSEEEELHRRAGGQKQGKLQKFENEAKGITGVILPHHSSETPQQKEEDKAKGQGNRGPVVSGGPASNEQRPGPGTIQGGVDGYGGNEAEGQKSQNPEESVHHATTTTTTTTTTTHLYANDNVG